ncbi:MAG: hypothetical protein O9318_00465 [Hylemonella sp.]|uniref:hypothetical protein n=1 Tax=Hylemonella sp. TaxID=2066020 RepID=UPI0022C9AF48|nr:hypothetical protein [Hylemonella sp.]MCZ8250920.1 hypothetical protein [Hylemonella sp.]
MAAAAVGLCVLLLTQSAAAREVQRLYVDLDGDSKVEAITLAASEADVSGRSQISVRIGSAVFSAEHHVLPEARIDMRAIIIDRQRPQRQLALTVQQADGCVHHLLAYTPRRLVRLLPIVGDADCQLPSLAGDGVVEAKVWPGDGIGKKRYRLGADGLSMLREEQSGYLADHGRASQPQ